MIVIPAIDIQNGSCVRLTQGQAGTTTVYSNSPLDIARDWVERGARLLHVVDLDGAFAGEPKNRDLIGRIVREAGAPIEVAGGIRTFETAAHYIECGADRIVIGTKVIQDPGFLQTVIAAFGRRVWVGLDARDGRVMLQGWTEPSGTPVLEVAREVARLGIGGIIFTDIRRDGMLQGPNLEAIEAILHAVEVPVVASGGVASLEDLLALNRLPRLAGVIVGKALYAGTVDLAQALARLETETRPC